MSDAKPPSDGGPQDSAPPDQPPPDEPSADQPSDQPSADLPSPDEPSAERPSDQPPLDHVPPDEPPRDHVPPDSDNEPQTRESGIGDHLKSPAAWLRLLFMVLFVALWFISRFVVFAVMGLQVLFLLFSGKPDARLAAFGASLAAYSYEVVAYLTFASETQPFPFSDWPEGSESSAPSSEDE